MAPKRFLHYGGQRPPKLIVYAPYRGKVTSTIALPHRGKNSNIAPAGQSFVPAGAVLLPLRGNYYCPNLGQS